MHDSLCTLRVNSIYPPIHQSPVQPATSFKQFDILLNLPQIVQSSNKTTVHQNVRDSDHRAGSTTDWLRPSMGRMHPSLPSCIQATGPKPMRSTGRTKESPSSAGLAGQGQARGMPEMCRGSEVGQSRRVQSGRNASGQTDYR